MNQKTWISGWRIPGKPYVEQFKDLLLNRTRALNKTLELLHLQLIRKGRVRNQTTFYHPVFKQNLYFCNYDIKSPSGDPYSYNGAMGLNQFFVGQDPYKPYQGSTKDGIYHDDCTIMCGMDGGMGVSIAGYYTWISEEWPWGAEGSPVYNTNVGLYWEYKDSAGFEVHCGDPYFYAGRRFSKIYKVYRETIAANLDENGNIQSEANNHRGLRYRFTFYTKAYQVVELSGGVLKAIETGQGGSLHFDEWLESETHPLMSWLTIASYTKYSTIHYESFIAMSEYNGSYWSEAEFTENGTPYSISFTDPHSGRPYTLYPVANIGNGYWTFHDGRVGEFWWGDNRIKLTESYYSSNHHPTRGVFKWAKEWNTHYYLYVHEDKESWTSFAPVVAIVIAFAAPFVAPYFGVAAGFSAGAGVGATLATISFYATVATLALTLANMRFGSSALSKIAKAIGFVATITGVASAISSVMTSLKGTLASNASRLSASSIASSQGLSQTASLYATTGGANASAIGSNLLSSTTLSGGTTLVSGTGGTFLVNGSLATNLANGSTMAVSGSSLSAFSSSVNVATGNITIGSLASSGSMIYSPATANALMPSVFTGAEIGSSSNLLSSAFEAGSKLYKAFGDTREIFREANKFDDDEVPSNDDKPRINWIPMNSDIIKRRYYSVEQDYDLGLEQGTLLYLKSTRDSLVVTPTQNI